MESVPPAAADPILGTEQYAAPEYFLGEPGTARSDIFSVGVIAYQLLSGKLPYGAQVPKTSAIMVAMNATFKDRKSGGQISGRSNQAAANQRVV